MRPATRGRLRFVLATGIAAALLAVSAVGASAQTPVGTGEIEVTLLGTGDPTPRLDRFGPATLVRAGGRTLLFDAGRGAMQRLFQLGVSTGDVDAIFITHLHSDHVVGLVDLWLTGWVVDRRTAPLRVYGPAGTREMVEHLSRAFEFDVAIRTSEARRDPDGARLEVVEIGDGFRWKEGGVVVTAFDVDHHPVEPALGFRVDHAGRAVALSGDTRPSESLVRHARGVDLLVHEVAEAPAAVRAANPDLPRLAHHTGAEDAGRVFAAIRPKLAVLSHLVLVRGFPAGELIPLVRRTYDGPVMVGEDGTTFVVGDSAVVLPPPGPGPPPRPAGDALVPLRR